MNELSEKAREAVDRCPHCGNRTGLEVTPTLRFRCRICGGPRVPIVGEHSERSDREGKQLQLAKSSHRKSWLYMALAVASGGAGGISFLVTLLTLWLASGVATGWATLLLFPTLGVLVALWAWRRSRRASQQTEAALDAAWTSVVHELLANSKEELTSAELGEQLLIDEQQADQLLAQLSVDDQVRSRITEDGRLTYSARAPHRVRVASAAQPGGVGEYDDTQLLQAEDWGTLRETALMDEAPVSEPSPAKRK